MTAVTGSALPPLGPPGDGELTDAAAALARAFRDNPLNVAVVGGRSPASRLRSNLHGMRSLLPVARVHGHVLVARSGDAAVGALVGVPPHGYPLPPPPLGPRLRCLWGQGWRVVRRWSLVFEALEGLHPVEPHWYLGTLGVDPSHQGRGLGVALLECWLNRVDREGMPAYLETDVLGNVAFYARAGFEVEGEAEVLGVRIWRMRRGARGT